MFYAAERCQAAELWHEKLASAAKTRRRMARENRKRLLATPVKKIQQRKT
jgi:hypothetical protein